MAKNLCTQMTAWRRIEPLKVERITVAIADLPLALHQTKLVQLSDLHYDGIHLSEKLLTQAIKICNREHPDLIVLTGDYIVFDPKPIYQLTSHLQRLQSRKGIYACLGNHDLYHPMAKNIVTKALNQIGVKVLWNAIAYPFGEQFPLIGLADFESPAFSPVSVLNSLNSQIPRLVLSHNPDSAQVLQNWRVDLQLSGHTHGGQIVLPPWGSIPGLLVTLGRQLPQPLQPLVPLYQTCSKVLQHWQWVSGLHQIDNNQLYVNRGLGTYFPGRWFCPPELTVITLVREN